MLLGSSAFAQQQPDISTLQHIIAVLQQQRNEQADARALAEAKLAQLSEELSRLKAEKKDDQK